MVGSIVISLDTELAWGHHGFSAAPHLSSDGMRERGNIRRLLEFFDRFEVPVTWAVVGHLFLDECDGEHAEMPRPPGREEWYGEDPGSSWKSDQLRYGRDVVEAILEADTDHEVATHTFSCPPLETLDCGPNLLAEELRRCGGLAKEFGLEVESLVFPRNEVKHLGTVREEGIEVYRGVSPENEMRFGEALGRYRMYLRFLTRPAPVVEPVEVLDGVWNLPMSQYLPYDPLPGLNERLPSHPRVRRAKRAIDRAKEEGKVFHLAAHPHNFDQRLFRDLEKIVRYGEAAGVEFVTMRGAVDCFEGGVRFNGGVASGR